MRVKAKETKEIKERLHKLPQVMEVVIDNISLEEILDVLLNSKNDGGEI